MYGLVILDNEHKSADVIVINIGGTQSTAGIVKEGKLDFQISVLDVSGITLFKRSPQVVTKSLGLFTKVHQTGKVCDDDNVVVVDDDFVVVVVVVHNDDDDDGDDDVW